MSDYYQKVKEAESPLGSDAGGKVRELNPQGNESNAEKNTYYLEVPELSCLDVFFKITHLIF